MEADGIGNIVLIGFSGTGKTTVGRLLAQQLNWEFVDIDLVIEERCGMSIESIFQLHGEPFFRDLEKKMAQAVSARDGQVVSTGGGVVLFPDNVTALQRNGILVALNAPADVVLTRLTQDAVVRPLLKKPDPLEAIRRMMQDRAEMYTVADVTMDTGGFAPEEIAGKIVDALVAKGWLSIDHNSGGNHA